MNLNAPELNLTVESLTGKMVSGSDFHHILQAFNLPSNNSFVAGISGILPENLSRFNEDGFIQPLQKTILDQTIDANLNEIAPIIKSTVEGSIKSSLSPTGLLEGEPAAEEVEKLEKQIKQRVDTATSQVQKFIIESNKFTNSNVLASKFNTNINNLIQSKIDNFSNKQIRDLTNDSLYFDNMINIILIDVLFTIKNTAMNELNNYVKPSDSITSSSTSSTIKFKTAPYKINAYVRNYYTIGDGADPDTFSGKTVFNYKYVSGRTCAVDNSSILLNSKVIMPDGKEFLAVDTFVGSSVRPAVYLYFESRQEADSYLNKINATLTNKLELNVIPPISLKIPKFDRPEGVNVSIRGIDRSLV